MIVSLFVLVLIEPAEVMQVSVKDASYDGPTYSSYVNDPSYFDEAYEEARKLNGDDGFEEFDETPRAGILPHHLIFPELIAEYFERLAETRDVETFFLIGPNHFASGRTPVHVSEYGFSTPSGVLEPDDEVVGRLLEESYISHEEVVFSYEHSISSLVPFIKRSFPDSRVVAVTLKYQYELDQFDEFIEVIGDQVGRDDFVLGSIDFSHYMPLDVASFHDDLSQEVIESFNYRSIDSLEIDSKPTLYSVMRLADEMGAQDVEVLHNTNSADQFARGDEIAETTSHFYIAFKDGEADAARQFSVLAVGDIMLGRFVRTLMDANGHEYPFENIRGLEDRFFEGADVIFGNLEGPIYKDGYKSSTSLIFGFPEYVVPLLKKFNFGVLSLANNHMLNQGVDGFVSTIGSLRGQGIGVCGNPIDEGRAGIEYRRYGENLVGFVCFNDVEHDMDDEVALETIRAAKSRADYVIVSAHWGYEYKHVPNDSVQVERAHGFVDAGADLVIGHHPHVVQGIEIYDGVPILYSLGNFIFDQYWSYDTEEGLAAGIVMGEGSGDDKNDGDFSTKIYLFPIHSERSQPRLMTPGEKDKFFGRFIEWGGYEEEMAEMIRGGVIEF